MTDKKIDGINRIKKKDLAESRKIVLDSIDEEIRKRKTEKENNKKLPKKVDGLLADQKNIEQKTFKSKEDSNNAIHQAEKLIQKEKQQKSITSVDGLSKKENSSNFNNQIKEQNTKKKVKNEVEIKIDKKKRNEWKKEIENVLQKDTSNPTNIDGLSYTSKADKKPKEKNSHEKHNVFFSKLKNQIKRRKDKRKKEKNEELRKKQSEEEELRKKQLKKESVNDQKKRELETAKTAKKEKAKKEKAAIKLAKETKKAANKFKKNEAHKQKLLEKQNKQAEQEKELLQKEQKEKQSKEREKKEAEILAEKALEAKKKQKEEEINHKKNEQEKNILERKDKKRLKKLKRQEKKELKRRARELKQEERHKRKEEKLLKKIDERKKREESKLLAKKQRQKAQKKEAEEKIKEAEIEKKEKEEERIKLELLKEKDLKLKEKRHKEEAKRKAKEKKQDKILSEKRKKEKKKKRSEMFQNLNSVVHDLSRTGQDKFLYIIGKVLSLIFAFTITFIFLYTLFVFLVLKLKVDNSLTRYIADYIFVPAFISQDGTVEYYNFKDYRDEIILNKNISKGAADISAKLLFSREFIFHRLLKNYNLPSVNYTNLTLPLREKINKNILMDIAVNQVSLSRIRKIKDIITEKNDFIRTASKYGDETGSILINEDNRDKFSYYDSVKVLEEGEISNIILTEDGYYIFRVSKKTPKYLELNYVHIKGVTLDEYLDRNIEGYKLWSFVD